MAAIDSAFEIRIDESQIRSAERLLQNIPRGFPAAMSRSINETMTTVRSRAVKDLAKAASAAAGRPVRQKDIRANLPLTRATRARLVGVIRVRGRTSAALAPGRAFMAVMPTGHKGIFRRMVGWKHRFPESGPDKGKEKHGLKIAALSGSKGPIRVIPDEQLRAIINQHQQQASELFERNFLRNVDVIIEQGEVKTRRTSRR